MAALVAIGLLAGCIGGDDGDDGGPPERPEVDIPTDTFRVGVGGALVVDPAAASLASARDLMVLDLLHDGLTRVDDAGVAQPALAESWKINPKADTFEFVLRADATFASGQPVTPQDVIASLERIMKAGDTSLPALSLEAVEGFKDFASGKTEHVSGLTAKNERTVRIALATPLSELPLVLSSPLMGVVDPETIEGDVGALDLSGAWKVAAAEDGVLKVENRDPAATLRLVELYDYDDTEDAYGDYEDGELDWVEVPSDRHDDAVEAYGADAFRVFQAELFFGLNVKSPALKSPPLRQAVALAINRQAIVDEVYADLADPLTSVVPAGIPGHDPARCSDCTYDPQKAEEVLAFGFPKGDIPTVHIDFDESEVQQAMAEHVAEDLDAVGITTELRPKPLEEYKAFVVSGDQELFSFGWIGAYRSPDAYLAPLFGSSANDNLTNFRAERVDELLEDARADTDAAKNANRWARAEQAILQSDVVVPIAQFRTQVVLSARVVGFTHAVDGSVDWTKVTLTG